jgi:hypothetical protein
VQLLVFKSRTLLTEIYKCTMSKHTPKGATTRQQAAATNSSGRSSIGGSAQSQLSDLTKKVDQLLSSHEILQKSVATLENVITKLDDTNKNLLEVNQQLVADNKQLSDELKRTKSTLSTVIDDLETTNQKFHNKTVEILGAVVGDTEHPGDFVIRVGCPVAASDIDNVYKKVVVQKDRPPRTKVIVTFNNLWKRMDFYYKCRKFKHNPPQHCEAGLRKLNVVDFLTHFKKGIFLNIIDYRKQYSDVIKNVWVSNGDFYIRRFGNNPIVEVVKNYAFVEAIFGPAASAGGTDGGNETN